MKTNCYHCGNPHDGPSTICDACNAAIAKGDFSRGPQPVVFPPSKFPNCEKLGLLIVVAEGGQWPSTFDTYKIYADQVERVLTDLLRERDELKSRYDDLVRSTSTFGGGLRDS